MFTTQIVLEGVEGCVGKGYSKKESHQLASKETLQRLRREPQFIDAVFAAKTARTKMEEEPVSVPEEVELQVIPTEKETSEAQIQTEDDFSLDDVSVKLKPKTREEIIAEAEEAAFAEASSK